MSLKACQNGREAEHPDDGSRAFQHGGKLSFSGQILDSFEFLPEKGLGKKFMALQR